MNNQLDIVEYQHYVIGLTKLTFDYYMVHRPHDRGSYYMKRKLHLILYIYTIEQH